MSRCSHLEELKLARNKLVGSIPKEMSLLLKLVGLGIDNNNLTGGIPPFLGNITSMEVFSASVNPFGGSIPDTAVNPFDLSRNSLSGSIPSEIEDHKLLRELDLSYNNSSGNITSSLGECISLTMLNLRGNILQGLVPASLSSLGGLEVLDISHNKLSGTIPQFLDKWKSLEILNLSFNDFEGEVPVVGVFANASAFSVLGNNKLYGGLVTLELPKEGKPVAAYVIQMAGYVDQLERLGYMLTQDLIVGLILNGLTKYFAGFVWKSTKLGAYYLKGLGCERSCETDTPDKLQQRFVKCIFIGYPKEMMGYYFYFPLENKIAVARYAEFFEKNLITQEGKQHLCLESKSTEIGLGQNAYMDKTLKRYTMDNSKRGLIPMQERLDLNRTQDAPTPK
ncbi:kinase-like domain-containing protein [Tanacetum coccineum]